MKQQFNKTIFEILDLFPKREREEEFEFILKEAKENINYDDDLSKIKFLGFLLNRLKEVRSVSLSEKNADVKSKKIEEIIEKFVNLAEFGSSNLQYSLLLAYLSKYTMINQNLLEYIYNRNEQKFNNEQKREIARKIVTKFEFDLDSINFIIEKTSRYWTEDMIIEIFQTYFSFMLSSNYHHKCKIEIISLLTEKVPFLFYKTYAKLRRNIYKNYNSPDGFEKATFEKMYACLFLIIPKHKIDSSTRNMQHLLNLNKSFIDIRIFSKDEKFFSSLEKNQNSENISLQDYAILIIANSMRCNYIRSEWTNSSNLVQIISAVKFILRYYLNKQLTEEIFKKVIILLNEQNPEYIKNFLPSMSEYCSDSEIIFPKLQKFIEESGSVNSEYKKLRASVFNYCDKKFEETIESVALNKIEPFIAKIVCVSKKPFSYLLFIEENLEDPTEKKETIIYLPNLAIENILLQELADDFPFSEFAQYKREKVMDILERTSTKMFKNKLYKKTILEDVNNNGSDINNEKTAFQYVVKRNDRDMLVVTEASDDSIFVPSLNDGRKKDEEKINISK